LLSAFTPAEKVLALFVNALSSSSPIRLAGPDTNGSHWLADKTVENS
jgi:hypothetical protein